MSKNQDLGSGINIPDPQHWFRIRARVSFETSFDSKQPKLVSALSETKRLFQFYTETESFGFWIEPKKTKEQLKECDREHILVFFKTKFRVVSKQFVSVLYRNREF
jgi:hypothetical protein